MTQLSLSLAALSEGVTFLPEQRLIVSRLNGVFRVYENRCMHRGGRFLQADDNGVLTCPSHGWRLDTATGQYTNPCGIQHPELRARVDGDQLHIDLHRPALSIPFERQTLQDGEYRINYLAHACAEVVAGERRIVFDPWCIGPSAILGRWLTVTPPADWVQRVAGADLVYFSHNHGDHINYWSLKQVVAVNPHVPMVVPDYDNSSCEDMLREIGFDNVSRVPFLEWQCLDDQLHYQILRDASGRCDSAILVSYKGHTLLNCTDANSPNGNVLPEVDVLMAPYAGGASGYPISFGEIYPEQHIRDYVAKSNRLALSGLRRLFDLTRPGTYMPFAQTIAIRHPRDEDMAALNAVNTPQDLERIMRDYPDIHYWHPDAGHVLDVGRHRLIDSDLPAPSADRDFASYTDAVACAVPDWFTPTDARYRDWLRDYFDWVGYRGDLVLEIVETDDTFEHELHRFMIDLSELRELDRRPPGTHNYERLRVRSSAFRYMLYFSIPWEELSQGIQARFYRDPDIYHFEFWNHVQNHLSADRFKDRLHASLAGEERNRRLRTA